MKNLGKVGQLAREKKFLDSLRNFGDDGASFIQLCDSLKWKSHGVKTVAKMLVQNGKIKKHPSLDHYFLIPSFKEKMTRAQNAFAKNTPAIIDENMILGNRIDHIQTYQFVWPKKSVKTSMRLSSYFE